MISSRGLNPCYGFRHKSVRWSGCSVNLPLMSTPSWRGFCCSVVLGVPIPEDISLISAGYLAHLGTVELHRGIPGLFCRGARRRLAGLHRSAAAFGTKILASRFGHRYFTPTPAAPGARLLPNLRQQGGLHRQVPARPALLHLSIRGHAARPALRVHRLRCPGRAALGAVSGVFGLVVRRPDRQRHQMVPALRVRHPGPGGVAAVVVAFKIFRKRDAPPHVRRVAARDAWGAAELCSARTIAGRFGNPLRVSITTRGEPPSFARRGPSREGLETLPGFPSQTRGEPPSFARRGPSREGLETLPGFPSQTRGEPPSFARRGPSREGLETLPGFPSQRVGSRRALLGADHRGKVWKPSQGFHHNAWGAAELCSARTIAGRFGRGKGGGPHPYPFHHNANYGKRICAPRPISRSMRNQRMNPMVSPN